MIQLMETEHVILWHDYIKSGNRELGYPGGHPLSLLKE